MLNFNHAQGKRKVATMGEGAALSGRSDLFADWPKLKPSQKVCACLPAAWMPCLPRRCACSLHRSCTARAHARLANDHDWSQALPRAALLWAHLPTPRGTHACMRCMFECCTGHMHAGRSGAGPV